MQNVTLYSYKELTIATNGFSKANKIGEGGFGSVYKVKEACLIFFIALGNRICFYLLEATIQNSDGNSLGINRENLGMGRWLQSRFSLLTRDKELESS